ncbi:MAG: hypothetical protein J0L50_05080 [Sphingomonadales bacterium]|nr:hypothetical protein [Sphingomonadales bacterium]
MTISPLRPQSHYGNASDCIVGAFLQALDLKKAAQEDHSLDCVFPGAAFEGMLDTVADEGISTPAHAALAIAVAIYRVEELLERGAERDSGFDLADQIALERVRLTLHHLWDFGEKPEELTPIANHFDLRMPRQSILAT